MSLFVVTNRYERLYNQMKDLNRTLTNSMTDLAKEREELGSELFKSEQEMMIGIHSLSNSTDRLMQLLNLAMQGEKHQNKLKSEEQQVLLFEEFAKENGIPYEGMTRAQKVNAWNAIRGKQKTDSLGRTVLPQPTVGIPEQGATCFFGYKEPDKKHF